MPWRVWLVVLLSLSTGGCFLSTYQIASWTATGVSYMFSGKSIGDHALSLVMNQNCATFRMLRGKEICVDYGSDFESSWAAMASAWELPEQLTGTDQDVVAIGFDKTSPGAVAMKQTVEKTVAGTSLTPVNLAETGTLKSGKPAQSAELDGVLSRDRATSAMQESALHQNVIPASGSGLSGLVKAQPFENILAVTKTKTSAVQLSKPTIYLVMGSFRDKANAQRLGSKHPGIKTNISKVDRDGHTMYRLLTGPIEKASLKGIRVGLANAGIRHSWAVKLCSRRLTLPPCKAPVQEAKLPK